MLLYNSPVEIELRQTHSDALERAKDRQNDHLDGILCRPIRPVGRTSWTGYVEPHVDLLPRA